MNSADGLNNTERQTYLTAIDRLRELNVNESISLPQLVVVGDQSSGKSSLLEGISGFGFPIASDLCTRFATQIVLRRGPELYVKISIIPGPSSQADEATKVAFAGFEKVIEGDFGQVKFSEIVSQASFLMGLPATLEESAEPDARRFSDDLLKIEISGPEHTNLSIVDVPGLFHNPTKYQTEEDRQIIRDLISQYIEDQRTIILAVLDARNNLANQEVFALARSADPDGSRTVGVITKCDVVQVGDEQNVIQIARNEIEILTHGWFTVRNRTTKEIRDGITVEKRHRNERIFFKQEPWNTLPPDRCGVGALRTFLANLLYQHIRREFPRVAEEVNKLYTSVRKELEALGAPRNNAIEQRQYLIEVAMHVQKLVDNYLRGNYDASLSIKLRARLRIANDDFEKLFRQSGHKMSFLDKSGQIDEEYALENQTEDILNWIKEQYYDSRGSELPGTVNPALLEVLFREISEKWEEISLNYVARAEECIQEFTEAAHDKLIVDTTVRAALLRLHLAQAAEIGAEVRQELAAFLRDEQTGPLQTINNNFTQTLDSIRHARITHRFQGIESKTKQGLAVDLAELLEAANLSSQNYSILDIHDILKAYYKVAQQRFMDNVVNGVVERHLVGERGVLRLFTPAYVGQLSELKLAQLAAEPLGMARQREDLNRRLKSFAEALEVIKPLL